MCCPGDSENVAGLLQKYISEHFNVGEKIYKLLGKPMPRLMRSYSSFSKMMTHLRGRERQKYGKREDNSSERWTSDFNTCFPKEEIYIVAD